MMVNVINMINMTNMTNMMVVMNMMNMTNMTNMMVVINMMNMLFRLDQQKEKALVAAYSNAGNPVSGLLTKEKLLC